MAYRAEIEIGVKGAQKLKELQRQIEKIADRIDLLGARELFERGAIQNIKTFNSVLKEAEENLRSVSLGTDEEADAIKSYVDILGQANTARDRQNKLIKEQIELQKFARKGQGPSSPTALSSPLPAFVGPRQATSAQAQAAITQGVKDLEEVYASIGRLQEKQVARENERVEALGRGTQEVLDLARAAKMGPKLPPGFNFKEPELRVKTRLAEDATIKQINKRRVEERKLLATQIEYDLKAMQARLDSNDKVFKDRIKKNKQELDDFDRRLRLRDEARSARARRDKTRSDAVSSAIIGGAFPLLFGQGIGAAFGGGLGGAAGGLLGGQFGFGLSLVGTALGSAFDTVVAKTAELGRALNSLNPDVEAITESLGIAGTETERYIQALVETGKETEAAAFALRKLEELIGFDGVQALDEFGQESQELTNEMAKFFTQMQAGIAQLINSTGIFRTAIEGVARTVTLGAAQNARGRSAELDKALDALDKERRDPKSGLAGMGIGALVPQAPTEAETAVLREFKKVQLEAGEIIDANAVKREKEAKITKDALKTAQYKLAIEEGNNDVLNETVQNAIRAKNIEKTRLEIKKAGKDPDKLALAFTNASIRSKQLENRISKAIEARDRKADAKKAAADKEAERAAKEILALDIKVGKEKLKQAELEQKISLVGKDKLSKIQGELDLLSTREALDRAFIISSTGDAKLQKEKLSTLQLQYDLKKKQLEQTKREIELQETASAAAKALSAAAGFDAFGAASRDIGAFAPSGGFLSPSTRPVGFDEGAQLAPIIQQEVAIERLLEKYEQIGEAGRAAGELVTFGFRDMVSGAKSAEQVFADFLNSLADMLLKTAQQMIAQYIAIGIARMFAVGGSPSSAVSGVDMNQDFFKFIPQPGAGGFPIPRANGGPVSGGSPYMVGERGPELFVPSNSGTVVPNNALGGNVSIVVNVTEGQTDARGGDGQANQLGKSIAAAVQSELIKQKRPGGLLAR